MRQGQQAAAARGGFIRGLRGMLGDDRMLNAIFRGGLVGAGGMLLSRMTGQMIEMQKASEANEQTWEALTNNWAEHVPILGGFVTSAKNIMDLTTGIGAEFRKVMRDAEAFKRITEEFQRTARQREQDVRGSQLSTFREQDRRALIGAEGTMGAVERLRIEHEAERRADAEARRQRLDAMKQDSEELRRNEEAIANASTKQTWWGQLTGRDPGDPEEVSRLLEQRRMLKSLQQETSEQRESFEKEEQAKEERRRAEMEAARAADEQAQQRARREHFRSLEEEARQHRLRMMGIEEDAEIHRLRSAEQWAAAERAETKRRYEQQINDLREQTRRRWQEEADAREAVDTAANAPGVSDELRRANAQRAQEEADRRRRIAQQTEDQNAETERALRARLQQELEQQARNERIAGLERERTVYGELFRLRMDFIDTSTEFGRKEAERLRIEEKHLAIQERMDELLRDQNLTLQERQAIEAMRASLPEQMQRELDRAGRREPGRVSPYAQGVSGRGFTGVSEAMAEKVADAEAQQRAKQTKAAEESAKAAKDMLAELKQLPQRLREALNLESR